MLFHDLILSCIRQNKSDPHPQHLYKIFSSYQRCCCECGKVNLCELVWMAHCLFHIGWAAAAVTWLAGMWFF
jgi:hypothetical protein